MYGSDFNSKSVPIRTALAVHTGAAAMGPSSDLQGLSQWHRGDRFPCVKNLSSAARTQLREQ